MPLLWQGQESKAHEEAWARLKGADGILVPGGFGTRGVEGKVLAAHYARTANKPYLGICLGMQIAVIEFARNVLGLADANSAEFDAATPAPVVVFMPEGSTTHKGGTMRLGSRRTILETVDCVTAKLYQARRAAPAMPHLARGCPVARDNASLPYSERTGLQSLPLMPRSA